MLTKAVPFVIAALIAVGGVSGQTADRVFHVAYAGTAQDLAEMAAAVRRITDIERASVDTERSRLALRGTEGQVALGEWLIHQFDQPTDREAFARRSQDSSPHEYRLTGSGDDVVGVFYLAHAETVQELQEITIVVNSLGSMRRMYTYNPPRAVVVRDTAEQVRLAGWLVHELDKPANQPESQDSDAHEYKLTSGRDYVVRLFYLKHAETFQDFQEVYTLVRAAIRIRWAFAYYTPRAVACRGTPDQIALAEWLFHELDQPGGQEGVAQPHEYKLSGSEEDAARV